MTPADEPRARNAPTEKSVLLGPIVFVPALVILVFAMVMFVVIFWG